jgi:hypothetical protein
VLWSDMTGFEVLEHASSGTPNWRRDGVPAALPTVRHNSLPPARLDHRYGGAINARNAELELLYPPHRRVLLLTRPGRRRLPSPRPGRSSGESVVCPVVCSALTIGASFACVPLIRGGGASSIRYFLDEKDNTSTGEWFPTPNHLFRLPR